MRTLAIPSLVCVAVLACGTRAFGQDRDVAAAEVLFREARTAMQSGDFASACAKFEESDRLDPAPGTLLNLAECEERRGRVATAWGHLRRALDTLAPDDDRKPIVLERAQALEQRLPRLVIRLSTLAPPNSRVRRDSVALGPASLGSPLPLDPGPHELTVSALGRRDRRYAVVLEESKLREVVLDAGPPRADRPAPEPRADVRWIGWSALGLGVASLGAGAITGRIALDRDRTMDHHCDSRRFCDPVGLDAGREGSRFATISTATFIVGATLAVAGVAWLVIHPTRR